MDVPITTPQVHSRLGTFKDELRPFTVVTVPFPKRETVKDPLWTGYFIMPHIEKLNDLHGRTMVNIVSDETFHIYDKYSSRLLKPPGWLSLTTMEDEINHIMSRVESKFCASNGKPAKQSACLCAGTLSRVSFILSARRRLRAGRAALIRPYWLQRGNWTRRMKLSASMKE